MNNITHEPTVAAEVRESDQLADTLFSLQNIIERNASALAEVKGQIKHKKESVKSTLENDAEYQEALEEVQKAQQILKQRKAALQAQPQLASLNIQVKELKEKEKEIKETLSNHLVNYHSMTNSKSFDTSNSDQCEFVIEAKIKTGQLKLFG